MDPTFFVLFFSIYFLCLLALALSSLSYVSFFVGMLFLIGLPPLGIFWAKFAALLVFPLHGVFVLFFSTALTLIPYLQVALSYKSSSSCSMSYLSLLVTAPVALFAFFILIVL